MAEQNASVIVDKVWGLCNVLRAGGANAGDGGGCVISLYPY